jgi:hypothetical protein
LPHFLYINQLVMLHYCSHSIVARFETPKNRGIQRDQK